MLAMRSNHDKVCVSHKIPPVGLSVQGLQKDRYNQKAEPPAHAITIQVSLLCLLDRPICCIRKIMEEPAQSSPSRNEADDQPPPETKAHHAPSNSIQVEIFDALSLLNKSSLILLTDLATRALANLPNQGDIRVSIVDDQRMSIAHEKFSGITGTTDVLTFDLAPETNNFNQKTIDTDLTICYDEAIRQAIKLNHPVEHELLLYIIHGTLHCLGYNDHDDAEYQRMHIKEDELLAKINIKPTFFTQEPNS